MIGWLLLLFGIYLLITGHAGPFVAFATKKGAPTTADKISGALNASPLMSPLTSLFGL